MTIEQLLYIIICVCFFLFGFIAFVNPNKVNILANRWLGLFFVFAGLKTVSFVTFSLNVANHYRLLTDFVDVTAGLMPVFLYLSIVQFATPGGFNKKHYLSFIPAIVVFCVVMPFHIVPGFKGYPLLPMWNRLFALTILLIVNLQIWLLWILAYYKLNRHQKNIQLVASNTTAVDLRWLKYLLIAIGFMMLVYVGNNLLRMQLHALYEPIIYLGCSLAICYYLIGQKEIFPYQPSEVAEVNQLIVESQHQPKPIRIRFEDGVSQKLKLRLEYLMTEEKLFLDSDLNLPQLAQSMEVSVHDLSYLLNDVIGLNFFQFVNTYRIEEAKQLMLSGKHKHFNILGIAYSAGFSSKTTFNTSFKKQTGVSPSEYIKQANRDTLKKLSFE